MVKKSIAVKIFLSLIILSSFSFSLDDINDEERIVQKTKVLACVAVTKSRMAQDSVIKIII